MTQGVPSINVAQAQWRASPHSPSFEERRRLCRQQTPKLLLWRTIAHHSTLQLSSLTANISQRAACVVSGLVTAYLQITRLEAIFSYYAYTRGLLLAGIVLRFYVYRVTPPLINRALTIGGNRLLECTLNPNT